MKGQYQKCRLKNKKIDLWLKPWSLTLLFNLDRETLDHEIVNHVFEYLAKTRKLGYGLGTQI